MSPRTARQNQILREKSEEKILSTALQAFGRFGYEGASMRTIAREAGISLGLTYNYFESKEVLLMTLVMQGLTEFRTASETVPGLPPDKELDALLAQFVTLLRSRADFWKLFFGMRMQDHSRELLSPAYNTYRSLWMTRLRSIYAAMGKPHSEDSARLAWAMIDGASQHFLAEPAYPLSLVLAQVPR